MQLSKPLTVTEQHKLIEAMMRDTDDTALYVLNVSDKPDEHNRATEMAGDILMLVTPANSQVEQIIRLPSTYVPLNLAIQGQATKQDILRSANFSRMLAAKRLVIIPTADALAIIDKDSHSREEYSRMQARAMRIHDESQEEAALAALQDDEPVNINLQQAVEQYNQGKIRMGDLVNVKRRIGTAITDTDLRYLSKEVPTFPF